MTKSLSRVAFLFAVVAAVVGCQSSAPGGGEAKTTENDQKMIDQTMMTPEMKAAAEQAAKSTTGK
jgi:hypothetical protein